MYVIGFKLRSQLEAKTTTTSFVTTARLMIHILNRRQTNFWADESKIAKDSNHFLYKA
jgi:hypothetical protein